jgi:O-antigen ligase
MPMTRASQPFAPFHSILANCGDAIRTVLIPMLGGKSATPDHRRRLWEVAIILLGATAVATITLLPMAALVLVAGCAALWFLGMVGDAFRGRLEALLLLWAAVFPLGYYFLSFPREQSLVNLDRVVVLVAIIGLFVTKPNELKEVPAELQRAGLACLAFMAISCISLKDSPNPLNAVRILFDGFLLPVLLGWCVIAKFDVRGRLSAIHTAVCISSIISAAVAAAEIVTRQDLFPIGTPAVAYGGIVRPNGPFESNDSLALIGAVSFFFLLFLRTTLGQALSAGRRVLHATGLAATLGMALMPMFRSVAITLLLVLIVDTFCEQRGSRRAWRVVLMLGSAGAILLLPIFAPDVFEDRSSSENAYSRVAEYKQSFRVFVEHPALGVGFQNFNRYVTGEPRFVAAYRGVYSVDWPHSNVAQVLTETGILGFVPYMLASVFLFRQMWQLRQWSSSGYLASKYFLYMFLSYWITGLTEGSGYSPLNLVFVFAVAVSCKYVLSDPALVHRSKVAFSDTAFGVPSGAY